MSGVFFPPSEKIVFHLSMCCILRKDIWAQISPKKTFLQMNFNNRRLYLKEQQLFIEAL